jgi:hypothetical protein
MKRISKKSLRDVVAAEQSSARVDTISSDSPSVGSRQSEVMFSSCGTATECVRQRPHSFRLHCSECAEVLHQISNVMTAVLMNARILGWKLPSYSHLKRPLHELERNSQRGAELLNGLMRRLSDSDSKAEGATEWCSEAVLDSALLTVSVQEPNRATERRPGLPSCLSLPSAPGFLPQHSPDLTVQCDPCTSGIFPKGDDGEER